MCDIFIFVNVFTREYSYKKLLVLYCSLSGSRQARGLYVFVFNKTDVGNRFKQSEIYMARNSWNKHFWKKKLEIAIICQNGALRCNS